MCQGPIKTDRYARVLLKFRYVKSVQERERKREYWIELDNSGKMLFLRKTYIAFSFIQVLCEIYEIF